MKIAILLRGISYIENYKSKRATLNTDYRTYLESFREFWKDQDVDIFIHTYKHDHIDQLLEDFKPKAHSITDFDPKLNPYRSCNQSVVNVATVFRDYCRNNPDEKYDIACCTRFDLYYTSKFNMLRIDKPANVFMDIFSEDNFYILLPENVFDTLIMCASKWRGRSHHQIIMKVRQHLKKVGWHALFTTKVGGGRCPYYRIRSCPPKK